MNNQHRYDMKNPIYRFMGIFEFSKIPQQVTSQERAFNAMINRIGISSIFDENGIMMRSETINNGSTIFSGNYSGTSSLTDCV